ncbi:thiopeptide-type bacteriocin biosynthesis protein [Streptomyces sp. KK5PA1]|uniref:Thiopeptide-type bacteriocin biosynthesis protein n=2 Tax=Actinacidiphila acididurans TaxID=2784346 RepID=A0ABS2U0S3_9ACTN|nr:thiopeptide-type bacteriocin biosynthesis protein [Actinacidiphila acididurans]
MPTGHLAEDLERYRAAGRAALEAAPAGWHQVSIQFTDYPAAADTLRAYLAPALTNGPVGAWWFVRKHPHWRLRLHPHPDATTEDVIAHITRALDHAVSWGLVKDWRPGPYEPETIAFGGPVGMRLAHGLFHADSAGILDYLHRSADGHARMLDAKATSLLAMTLLMRAAGLEFGEQGDIWGQVEIRRPFAADVASEKVSAMAPAVRRLLLTDATELLTDGPLTPVRPWIEALQHSGRALADAAANGHLGLGLRGILARHVLFHWNRTGFTTHQQAIWSRAAREAVLGG